MSNEAGRTIAITLEPDHPACAGHFPGNPVIPGAVLLDRIVCGIAAAYNLEGCGGEIGNAKFLTPVRPGDTLEIRCETLSPGEVRFECLQAGKKALSGVLRLPVPQA
jgi:3-hydroxymyristoyl/3-hydroxydecanoyl-(acyl carrier protein) dehydratase